VKNSIKSLLCVGVLAALNLAAGPGKGAARMKQKWPNLSAEQRASMATIHEQMAACLRSDKPLGDCMQKMMDSCHDMMGGKWCPMTGDMHMMQRWMIDNEEPKSEAK